MKDYADDPSLLTNTHVQAEYLLHCIERAAREVGLNMNRDKTEFIRLHQEGAISCLNGKLSRLVQICRLVNKNIT